jgi:hypothetical protein
MLDGLDEPRADPPQPEEAHHDRRGRREQEASRQRGPGHSNIALRAARESNICALECSAPSTSANPTLSLLIDAPVVLPSFAQTWIFPDGEPSGRVSC